MYTLAVMNQKGGVGKTAVTINLGAALAEKGYRVLLVDLDPQGHLTEACGVPETTAPATLAKTLLADADKLTTEDVRLLLTPWRDRVDVIATNIDAFLLERELYRMRGVEWRLQRVLEHVESLDVYDACVIDCPPSLGVLTDNALVAAGQALVPVQSEDSALRALRLLLEQVATMQAELRVQIDLLGMVVNLFDKRRGQIVTSTLETLRTMSLPILGVVADRTAIREAWRAGLPVVEYAPDSPSAVTFRELAATLIEGGQPADAEAAAAGAGQ
ncbi:ParA family protein [Actinomadura viridis]|uniref:ParA family protein n=1 Tax=Actinomadura viridis TaxID=58110 RepID=UPI0036AFBFED